MQERTIQDQRDRDTFLRLIGDCISQWAFVDRELFRLCRDALGTTEKRAAVVFYSWASIQGHLSLADNLMKLELPRQKFLSVWRPLHKQIGHHLETRSIIAHQPIKQAAPSQTELDPFPYTIHIEPAEQLLERTYRGLAGKVELAAKDLRKHARSTGKLVGALEEFREYLAKNRQT